MCRYDLCLHRRDSRLFSQCTRSPKCISETFRPITAGGAGRIACRVIHSVKAFHHRVTVQGVPVVGRLSGLSARRSPVEAMRSVVFVALIVKERCRLCAGMDEI